MKLSPTVPNLSKCNTIQKKCAFQGVKGDYVHFKGLGTVLKLSYLAQKYKKFSAKAFRKIYYFQVNVWAEVFFSTNVFSDSFHENNG